MIKQIIYLEEYDWIIKMYYAVDDYYEKEILYELENIKCSQDIIPIKALWEDGIFLIGNNKYSKSYKFIDINYAVASREDKESMFLDLPILIQNSILLCL